DGGVLDLLRVLDQLDLRVHDPRLVVEELRQVADRDVAVLVDGRRQDGAAVLAVPGGVVRAAAEERDPERGAADDHRLLALWKNSEEAAYDSGVPMSMNAKVPGSPKNPAPISDGNVSRSRETSRPSGISSSTDRWRT